MKKIILFVIALFMMSACSSASPSVEGDWKLVSYGDASNPTSAVPDVDTNINFDSKGQMSGNLGCNGFGGNYEVSDSAITFKGIMSTMMYCDATSPQEQGVLGIFSDNVKLKMQVIGDVLTITSADGASVVNLSRK